ncbi:hypothetical protein MIR68_011775 [Amoeboaphelidium protococcarum]|nr:hypothetical protein MIR68_011775 [Amoeboaphelidium protococcarum]
MVDVNTEYFVKRFAFTEELTGHTAAVNSIDWDGSGRYIVSGGDDRHLNIYDTQMMDDSGVVVVNGVKPKHLVHRLKTKHQGNIFSAKFMNGTSAVIAGGADFRVSYTDINAYYKNKHAASNTFNCHAGFVHEVVVDPLNPVSNFFSCSEDGTVNQYDLRIRTSCSCQSRLSKRADLHCNRHTLIDINVAPEYNKCHCCDEFSLRPSKSASAIDGFGKSPFSPGACPLITKMAVTSMDMLSTDPNYIALGCNDSFVRVFDRRKLTGPIYHSPTDDPKFRPTFEQRDSHSSDNQYLYPPSLDCYKGLCYSFSPSHMRFAQSVIADQYGLLKDAEDRVMLSPADLQRQHPEYMKAKKENKLPKSLYQRNVANGVHMNATTVASVRWDVDGKLAVSYFDEFIYVIDVMSSILGANVKCPRQDGPWATIREYDEMDDPIETPPAHIFRSLPAKKQEQIMLNLQRCKDAIDVDAQHRKIFAETKSTMYLPLFSKEYVEQYDHDILHICGSHVNAQAMIQHVSFIPNYIAQGMPIGSSMLCSGSDDGFVYCYIIHPIPEDRFVADAPFYCWRGDRKVVNMVAFNPKSPVMIVSGLDTSIKVFEPVDGIAPEVEKIKFNFRKLEEFQSGYTKALSYEQTKKVMSYSALDDEFNKAINKLVSQPAYPQFSNIGLGPAVVGRQQQYDFMQVYTRLMQNGGVNMFGGTGLDLFNINNGSDEEEDEDYDPYRLPPGYEQHQPAIDELREYLALPMGSQPIPFEEWRQQRQAQQQQQQSFTSSQSPQAQSQTLHTQQSSSQSTSQQQSQQAESKPIKVELLPLDLPQFKQQFQDVPAYCRGQLGSGYLELTRLYSKTGDGQNMVSVVGESKDKDIHADSKQDKGRLNYLGPSRLENSKQFNLDSTGIRTPWINLEMLKDFKIANAEVNALQASATRPSKSGSETVSGSRLQQQQKQQTPSSSSSYQKSRKAKKQQKAKYSAVKEQSSFVPTLQSASQTKWSVLYKKSPAEQSGLNTAKKFSAQSQSQLKAKQSGSNGNLQNNASSSNKKQS